MFSFLKFKGKEIHSRCAADTNALSSQLIVLEQDKLKVEEDQRPDLEEDIYK